MSAEAQWDLFRTFEAVARLGSLTRAARSLGLSQSTVSRHLQRLEEEAGSPLLLRASPIVLTERGEALLAAIEPMVDAALSARATLGDTPELRGLVTLTTVGEVLRWALAPALPAFYRAYPQIRLHLLSSNEVHSLARGEADVAIRLARPERGDLVARKIGSETYGFFKAASLELGPEIPWLGLGGSLAQIPEQRHAERAFSSRPPRLLVEDIESLGLAVSAGLGAAVLPRRMAARLVDVQEVEPAAIGALDLGPIAQRDFWLIVHRSKQRLPMVRAVLQWIERVFDQRV